MMKRARLAEAQAAVMLLSRLPAGRIGGEVPSMGASVWAWPLVGALVGGLAALSHGAALWLGLPPLVAALLGIGALVLATGAMHEDGLADLADGFGGGQSRTRKLEIMRDSRIGTYGVLALVLSVGLRAAAIAALPADWAMAGFVALAMASRACLPLWLRLLPAARADGLGKGAGGVPDAALVAALVLGQLGWCLAGGLSWLPIAMAVFVGTALIAGLALRQIGGQTGDVLGAAQQVGEIFGWLALLARL